MPIKNNALLINKQHPTLHPSSSSNLAKLEGGSILVESLRQIKFYWLPKSNLWYGCLEPDKMNAGPSVHVSWLLWCDPWESFQPSEECPWPGDTDTLSSVLVKVFLWITISTACAAWPRVTHSHHPVEPSSFHQTQDSRTENRTYLNFKAWLSVQNQIRFITLSIISCSEFSISQ